MTTPARLHTHADILPGYQFARSVGRYRANATGRFVGRSSILDLLNTSLDANRNRLADITTAYQEGRLSGSVWLEEARTLQRRMHLQQSALGAGGFDRLGPREYGRMGGRLRGDYADLARLGEAIESGDVSLPQALNRANRVAGNARRDFWDAERDHRQRSDSSVVLIERNLLTAGAQHCADCVALYDRGWQMHGVLPPPGSDRICGSSCVCRLEIREVPASEIGDWLGTKR